MKAVGHPVGNFAKEHATEIVVTGIKIAGVVFIAATDGACAPVVGKAVAYGPAL